MIRYRVATVFVLTLIAFQPIAGQGVSLRLVDSTNRLPVVGAIVRLLGSQGTVAQGITNEVGRITLRGPASGTYRVTIDRIGYPGTDLGPFALSTNQVLEQEIRLGSRPQRLPEITVSARDICGFQGVAGGAAAALWEEIRKALTANLITQADAQPLLRVRQFVRETTFGGRLLREWTAEAREMRGQPFVAMEPGELSQKGFAYAIDDTMMYAAPDARLLLSDEFVATHCFRALPVSRADTLRGLEFRPVTDRALPDVRGAIWVDRSSSELRHIEYGYTGLPGLVQSLGPGGRVEFNRLDSGEWIVSHWFIRMVRSEQDPERKDPRLRGYLFRGGRAEPAGDGKTLMTRAIVLGTVVDSTVLGPLSGAVVRLEGTSDSATTDSSGRFRIESLAAGPRILEAIHPKLGLLKAAQQNVLLSIGDSTTVIFSVPSLATFARAKCRNGARTGVFGLVSRSDGVMAATGVIEANWGDAKGSRVRRAEPDQRGFFALCGLPGNQSITVRLLDNGLPVAEQHLVLHPLESLWLDLRGTSH